ncbi:carbonate dehydratase [Robbsia andropogonis]|uniref:carbonate dehydratase n=1 Tax=Robbsia andropogonis TaxID=28092 RepID=UPI0004642351|nr:carbonate dehydratase [Robbsia andropogonis]MCP1120664.1 carbonate dehydratase [Robbsia andropogonis]MCP1130399.1 carbonate dehydratase [Robbsia andropogonis]
MTYRRSDADTGTPPLLATGADTPGVPPCCTPPGDDADGGTEATLNYLFENNREWVDRMIASDPGYFARLADQQSPELLWIGCSDSRVPANEIIGLPPGEVFVHRNIANVVVPSDLNCLSVIQFAVDVLKIRHIVVVGHYGCSGVRAAMTGARVGLADNWLRHVQDVRDKHADLLERWPLGAARHRRLVELNTMEQVVHVCNTNIVLDAWQRGQPLTMHGWTYGVHDGRLRDLGMTVSSPADIAPRHDACVKTIGGLGSDHPESVDFAGLPPGQE